MLYYTISLYCILIARVTRIYEVKTNVCRQPTRGWIWVANQPRLTTVRYSQTQVQCQQSHTYLSAINCEWTLLPGFFLAKVSCLTPAAPHQTWVYPWVHLSAMKVWFGFASHSSTPTLRIFKCDELRMDFATSFLGMIFLTYYSCKPQVFPYVLYWSFYKARSAFQEDRLRTILDIRG